MTEKPYTDADIEQLTAMVRARIGQPISAGEAGTIVTVVLQELAVAGRLAPVTDPTVPPPGWAYVGAVWQLQQHIDTIRAHWATLLPRDVGETLLARSARVAEEQAALTPAGIDLSALAASDPRHIIAFGPKGWTIKHPLSCRPQLFDCPVNRAAEQLDGLPVPAGRYEADVNDLGDRLLIGDRVDSVEG